MRRTGPDSRGREGWRLLGDGRGTARPRDVSRRGCEAAPASRTKNADSTGQSVRRSTTDRHSRHSTPPDPGFSGNARDSRVCGKDKHGAQWRDIQERWRAGAARRRRGEGCQSLGSFSSRSTITVCRCRVRRDEARPPGQASPARRASRRSAVRAARRGHRDCVR